jgi:hypothetical protein
VVVVDVGRVGFAAIGGTVLGRAVPVVRPALSALMRPALNRRSRDPTIPLLPKTLPLPPIKELPPKRLNKPGIRPEPYFSSFSGCNPSIKLVNASPLKTFFKMSSNMFHMEIHSIFTFIELL